MIDNRYLIEELARMRREESQARAEREQFMVEIGLDLKSVLRRAVAERIAQVRRALAAQRVPASVALTLVASAGARPREDRAA